MRPPIIRTGRWRSDWPITYTTTAGRPDALANAVWLLNRGGLATKLALPQAPLADLPDVGRAAATFGSQLGQRLMPII
jgi:hypothetical protein